MSYKIYKNSLNYQTSKNLFKLVLKSCLFYCPTIFKKNHIYKKNWVDQKFINQMKDFRKKDKKRFSAMYDSLQISNELWKIAYDNKLYKIAEKFLNVKKDDLLVRGLSFRIDFPNDTRNSYGWHQDNAYDKYNLSSKNGAVLWIPLIDTNEKNGTLIIKPRSYQSTFKCSRLYSHGSKYKSKQILVMNKYLKKYKSKSINVKKNSALTTYSGTFHKSGINTSKQIRFTLIIRFNKLFSKDFLFFRNLK